uniref:Translation initiation factor IF-2, chloroplastic n=1 Tax=Ceramothamnion japonicum TaxID=218448 RepID=A0A1C9CD53_CERJP|nr:translation initiation factor 2 [Ceramium japonicum]AOM66309.1 translation initiation factor 2 [Ceramium japonicum]
MINNYNTQYNQFKCNQGAFNHYTCHQNEYFDSLLILKNPKIISNLVKHPLSLNTSLVTLDNNFIDEKNNNIPLNNSSRFEKKNKASIYTEDILEIKKKKNKLQKKSRKQIDFTVEADNVFRRNASDILFNEENLNNDIIKVPKVNKSKKKYQNNDINHVVEASESIINRNSIEASNNQILINSPLTIQDLSNKLNIPEAEIITYLFLQGIPVTINQIIDISIAKDVALKYNFFVQENVVNDKVSSSNVKYDTPLIDNKLVERPPIITILGHVDHGKTTLLDTILNTNLAKKEFGGITQAIVNHEVEFLYEKKLYKLIFLDTPGHQAFSSLRVRSTQITDLVLLVVAADDGLKPQTIESIKYIFEKNLPYIVVINKIDKLGINTLKVREELAKYNIIDESWGGDAIITEVSALKHLNIDLLLSNICLLSSLQELKADPNQLAIGTIIDSYLDVKRGPVVVLVVKNGSLKRGDFIVAGNLYGKIKVITNTRGLKFDKAMPSSIVQILGFSSLPRAGESFHITHNKKSAEYEANNYQDKIIKINNLNNRMTWESAKYQNGIKNLNLVLKTDGQGSSEAIVHAFNNISQNKVQINILELGFGNISHTDIELGLTTNSIVIGFNVNISSQANQLAKKMNISVKTFNIIYDIIDYIILNMLNLLEPEYDQSMIGQAVVKTVFSINKGSVAGCTVIEGKLKKACLLNIYRDSKIVHTSTLNSLKHMKDDVNEVIQDNECGIMCYDYTKWASGDIVEAYELKEKEKTL